MWQRTIDCLGVAVGISSPVPALAVPLEAVFRTYADAPRAADLTYVADRAEWPRLVRDGIVIARHDEDLDLVPALEIDLYGQVMARAVGLVVHAGSVVGADGAALVFAGQSGAGKSTLVRALLSRGYRYLTEECVAFRAGQRCAGLARSMHVDDPGVALPGGFACDEYVLRQSSGAKRTRLFHPPASQVWRGEARVAAIVSIEHAPDAGNTLSQLSGGELLSALWPVVFRRDAAALADASTGLTGVAGYALRTSTPEQALERVLALADRHGVAP